jgi:hypothetical protein
LHCALQVLHNRRAYAAPLCTQLTRRELDKLAEKNQEIENQQRALENELEAKGHKVQQASLSFEGLRRRGQAENRIADAVDPNQTVVTF